MKYQTKASIALSISLITLFVVIAVALSVAGYFLCWFGHQYDNGICKICGRLQSEDEYAVAFTGEQRLLMADSDEKTSAIVGNTGYNIRHDVTYDDVRDIASSLTERTAVATLTDIEKGVVYTLYFSAEAPAGIYAETMHVELTYKDGITMHYVDLFIVDGRNNIYVSSKETLNTSAFEVTELTISDEDFLKVFVNDPTDKTIWHEMTTAGSSETFNLVQKIDANGITIERPVVRARMYYAKSTNSDSDVVHTNWEIDFSDLLSSSYNYNFVLQMHSSVNIINSNYTEHAVNGNSVYCMSGIREFDFYTRNSDTSSYAVVAVYYWEGTAIDAKKWNDHDTKVQFTKGLSDVEGEMAPLFLTKNVAVNLPTCAFKRHGYHFGAWTYLKTTGDLGSYYDSEEVIAGSDKLGTYLYGEYPVRFVEFTAMWEEIIDCTVFNETTVNSADGTTQLYQTHEVIASHPDPTAAPAITQSCTGYVPLHWRLDESCAESGAPEIVEIDGSFIRADAQTQLLVYNLEWRPIRYTINILTIDFETHEWQTQALALNYGEKIVLPSGEFYDANEQLWGCYGYTTTEPITCSIRKRAPVDFEAGEVFVNLSNVDGDVIYLYAQYVTDYTDKGVIYSGAPNASVPMMVEGGLARYVDPCLAVGSKSIYYTVDIRNLDGSGTVDSRSVPVYRETYLVSADGETIPGMYYYLLCLDGDFFSIPDDKEFYVDLTFGIVKPKSDIGYYKSSGNYYIDFFLGLDMLDDAFTNINLFLYDKGVEIEPLPQPYCTGYTFIGYRYDEAGLNHVIAPVKISGQTLYPKWRISSYTVSFASMGNVTLPQMTAEYYTFIDLPTPEREGFTFIGWRETMGGEVVDQHYRVYGNVTLYALWDSHMYDVDIFVGAELYKSTTAAHYVKIADIVKKIEHDLNVKVLKVFNGDGEELELTGNVVSDMVIQVEMIKEPTKVQSIINKTEDFFAEYWKPIVIALSATVACIILIIAIVAPTRRRG